MYSGTSMKDKFMVAKPIPRDAERVYESTLRRLNHFANTSDKAGQRECLKLGIELPIHTLLRQ